MTPTRYHPALVTLHWLLAFFLIGALVAGNFVLKPLSNLDPDKLISFRMHMGLGITILVLMIVRLVIRLRTAHPAPVYPAGDSMQMVATGMHWALYALAIGMSISGMAVSIGSGLGAAVWGDGPMPLDFDGLAARRAHGVLSVLLMVAIGIHIAAALYHQLIRKDRIMRRMAWKD